VHPTVSADADRAALERELLARGCALPIDACVGYPVRPGETRELLLVADSGTPCWGAVAESAQSRIVPWRRVARLLRVSGVSDTREAHEVAQRTVELMRTLRALRIHVEIFDTDPNRRERLATALRERGFARSVARRRYARTIRVDLAHSEDDLLAGFHATCRRHIRTFHKKGLRVAAVTDPALAPRLQSLLEESMSRTGGHASWHDWPAFIRFVEQNPQRAQLLGAFRDDIGGPEALVGYVVGLRHADAVEYATAASTRLESLKVPFLYAPAWELIRWARSTGAAWFDFGGVISADSPPDDPRHGISEFKRMFSENEIDVGDEYVLESPDLTARTVAAVRDLRQRYFRTR
jgi:hypothetical protein